MSQFEIKYLYRVKRGPVTTRLRAKVNNRAQWCGKQFKISQNDTWYWIDYIDMHGKVSIRDSNGQSYIFENITVLEGKSYRFEIGGPL